jgi:CHAT domain
MYWYFQKSDTPPNLWWCPTGPFVFLPIHAAGIFMTERTKDISDYGVSSYTPTISSLLSNIPNPTSNDPFKMMVVIQSSTPGEKPLPCTLDELQKIEAHVPVENLVKLVPGFVKDVLSNLQTASIAHFACHGQQYPRKPLESALLLQDGPLKVSQIMERSIPNASLAFLSACETAMGDESLPDEVIHLGATLLFAGFRGVVATMWYVHCIGFEVIVLNFCRSIADLDGPKVAGTFYESMFKETDSSAMNGPRPDTTQAARTLHLAVTKLRSENVPFIRWVPFIYLGR